MRVVQVNYAFDSRLGSAGALLDAYTTLTGWADAIARAGAEVLTVQQFHSSANVTRAGRPYTLGAFRAIATAVAAWRPDIVHVNGLGLPVHTWRLHRCLARAAAAAHTRLPRVVVQDHAGGAPRGGAARRAVRRRLMSVVDAFLFSVLEQAQPWRDAGLIAPHQSVHGVMEASTDLRALPEGEARSASGVTGNPAILWVGRLNANKDPLTVLAAFESFASARPGATLTMIFHEGDLDEVVRARIASSAVLRDRVRLAGRVPHDRIAAFFSAADLFVIGSHHEGSGYSLMEAIACGAIPVVTNIPTFRALTADGAIGRLWPPDDSAAAAQALTDAAASDLAAERRRVLDHFDRSLTWDAVGRRAVGIYADVLRERR